MIFNSLAFVAFFLIVYPLYRALPHRAQNVLLLAASYVFYAWFNWRFVGLLLASTVVDFLVARYLGRTQDARARRTALVASLGFNLTMLGVFKYFNFFAASVGAALARLGWHPDIVTLRVILPIGISFYTFITMSYVIDVYRREIEPEPDFLDFALFVAYFPHLVAGPILRASLLLPQIRRPRRVSRAQVREGLWLIAWGYFQKMFVADNLAPLVDGVFASTAHPHGLDVLVAVYAFAFQIYGDFAGYSNIARGVSKLMGIELNVNFLFPYFVRSPQEFWRHWHISLSTWLRDYLYIPLGGSRGSAGETRRNLLITMLLGGLWHGAAWTFVLWGAYQGAMLIAFRPRRGRAASSAPSAVWLRAVGIVAMFHVTCLGWLIFRARSFGQLAELASRLVTDPRLSSGAVGTLVLPLASFTLPLLIVHAYQARKGSELAVLDLRMPVRYALYGAVFYLILLFGSFQGSQFIYFQF